MVFGDHNPGHLALIPRAKAPATCRAGRPTQHARRVRSPRTSLSTSLTRGWDRGFILEFILVRPMVWEIGQKVNVKDRLQSQPFIGLFDSLKLPIAVIRRSHTPIFHLTIEIVHPQSGERDVIDFNRGQNPGEL